MALPVRKGYTGNGVQTTLTSSPTIGDTTFTVAAVTGWPTTFPFFVVVDSGTSKEEKMKVTAISSLTLTVARSADNTTAVAHVSGASIYPVFTASEADEANQVASAMTTKGDLIATDGSTINRLAVGATNTHVLQVDSTATNGFKWAQVATAGIADSAITSVKIADGAIVDADVNASAAIAYSKLNLGTSIVNADVSASAAIALSKLATGALPTAITVTSANISDLSIVDADVSASAAIALSKLATTGTVTATTFVGALTGNASGTSGSTTGNAATATALQTSRNIGGVSFNGTADINLPGVNASGNQNTSGTATNATNLVGMAKGSSVVSMTFGSADVSHGLGSTPSTAIVSNGDTAALSAAFEIYDLTSTLIRIVQIGGSYTGSVRVNWIAFA